MKKNKKEQYRKLILSKEDEALAFNNNRELVLEKYHLNDINIDKSSPEIQLLFALTDEDILSAIKSHDVNLYLKTLQNKGLFQTDKFKTMSSILAYSSSDSTDSEEAFSPIAICALAVALYLGVATVAETYVMVHNKFVMWGATQKVMKIIYMT